ncbi:hypothetical protein Nepgr_023433 [Nepenthes gracilis]|uniref:Pentatricopeptide repeat-containing protein n=1 Tax=Nepenthes gracilis TaxID=150966 RepID=A0AAD3T4A1_NEPGR|nr:hypothetical protein Nepgr_023433 [Nepenthes gracilis]
MHRVLNKTHTINRTSLSYYSNLIDQCLSLKFLDFAKYIHAQLIKVGFNSHTFLGNRCLDLYSILADVSDVGRAFEEISNKNTISWNIYLRGLLQFGEVERACKLFDQMPQRDVVGWNTMISGYAANGFPDKALKAFIDMQNCGVRPSNFTWSILTSVVQCTYHVKQIHGSMIRNGITGSSVVIGNTLIAMYGRLGLIDYVFGVFLSTEDLDVISWNSLISRCHRTSQRELALDQFCLMRSLGFSPDEFTMSLIITICSDLQDLEKGKQMFALCIKMGFLSNSIVSSASIDLFSKCCRLEVSAGLFVDIGRWDSAVCNSMIASYARHGFAENALHLFVLTLRINLSPTDFTLSTVLSSVTGLLPLTPGIQVHCLAVKYGFTLDVVIASTLVHMYAKYGMIESSLSIFSEIDERDLLCWNSMIMGLAQNGSVIEALDMFKEMLEQGPPPDHITFTGVLSACKYGGLIHEGMTIFSAMEKEQGIIPRDEHYGCIVDLMCRAGKLKEAMAIVGTMPMATPASIWRSILSACAATEDLELTEKMAKNVMEMEPHSSLPCLVLDRAYEMRGRWESVVKVRKSMKERGFWKVAGCSWIGIKSCCYVFKSNELSHYGGQSIYMILALLIWEMQDEGYMYQQFDSDGYMPEET